MYALRDGDYVSPWKMGMSPVDVVYYMYIPYTTSFYVSVVTPLDTTHE